MTWRIEQGEVRKVLARMPDQHFHTCVTSPPYWKLRDYDVKGQIGLEATPQKYVEVLVDVFREVHRVLRDDGTLWLNLGDTHMGDGSSDISGKHAAGANRNGYHRGAVKKRASRRGPNKSGLPAKNLVGIPWLVAHALQADGWYIRSAVIWHKPNPLPSSAKDRLTCSYEHVFLMTKKPDYFFDHVAIREPVVYGDHPRNGTPSLPDIQSPGQPTQAGFTKRRRSGNKQRVDGYLIAGHHVQSSGVPWEEPDDGMRHKRDVWTIATAPYKEAHFATFPPDLAEICIRAGASNWGSCRHCGTPWVRLKKRTFSAQPDVSPELAVRGAGDQKPHDPSNGWEGTPRGSTSFQTLGWRRDCQCWSGAPVPCRVLDPFAGAGTTLLVARRLGLDAVGVELKPEYVDMAERRIERDLPLLNRPMMPAPQLAANPFIQMVLANLGGAQ